MNRNRRIVGPWYNPHRDFSNLPPLPPMPTRMYGKRHKNYRMPLAIIREEPKEPRTSTSPSPPPPSPPPPPPSSSPHQPTTTASHLPQPPKLESAVTNTFVLEIPSTPKVPDDELGGELAKQALQFIKRKRKSTSGRNTFVLKSKKSDELCHPKKSDFKKRPSKI